MTAVSVLDLDEHGYEALVDETRRLVQSPEVKRLATEIGYAAGQHGTLDEAFFKSLGASDPAGNSGTANSGRRAEDPNKLPRWAYDAELAAILVLDPAEQDRRAFEIAAEEAARGNL